MPQPLIVGIDPSICNTALCWGRGDDEPQLRPFPSKKRGDGVRERLLRLEELAAQIDAQLSAIRPDAIFLEHYSFGSQHGGEYLGEWGGILRWHLLDHCRQVFEVPPTSLKKFITGKGSGKKEMMIAHVAQRWGQIFPTNDHVDAFCLFQFGLAAVGTVEMTNQAQRDAVAKTLGVGQLDLEPVGDTVVARPAF